MRVIFPWCAGSLPSVTNQLNCQRACVLARLPYARAPFGFPTVRMHNSCAMYTTNAVTL